MTTEAKSKFSVTHEAYDDFSVYMLGEIIIATASLVPEEGYWEVVVINEKDEQDVKWLCVCNRPSANDITVFHNHHFNTKEEDTDGTG